MTKQQLQSKVTPIAEKKPIKALGVISKIALGGALISLIIGVILMFTKNFGNKDFTIFICQLSTAGAITHNGFSIGWICFALIMIFILTALPYYLIHLLTFKRIIMTPIMLVLSLLAFGLILGCLFPKADADGYGIYKFSFDAVNATIKYTPTPLCIVTLIAALATFIVAFIPPRKKAK